MAEQPLTSTLSPPVPGPSDQCRPLHEVETSFQPTEITIRSDLSLLYRALRACIRPLRPKLVSIKPFNQTGSPRLVNRPESRYGVFIKERKVTVVPTPDVPLSQPDILEGEAGSKTQTLWLYDFEAQRSRTDLLRDGAKKELRHTVYYFAGGGFQAPASSEHWKFCARLAKDLTRDGVHVVMVSYPLSPKSPAKDSLPLLRNWLRQTLREAQETARSDNGVTLMGDSAGGNVVLSLAFWWSEELKALKEKLAQKDLQSEASSVSELESLEKLKSVLAISPPTDLRNVNPEIKTADHTDPVLTQGVTDAASNAWSMDWSYTNGSPKEDSTLSPALTSTEGWGIMHQSGLLIDGLFGSADVLAPDAQVFLNRCKEERIPGKWLVWDGQMHCFPLTVCYGLYEGKEAYNWIAERIKEIM